MCLSVEGLSKQFSGFMPYITKMYFNILIFAPDFKNPIDKMFLQIAFFNKN
ncbi:MAG: hypothetical protein ACI9XO_004726 [Paraglaciecola sp.]|jgi:hypothetical protein